MRKETGGIARAKAAPSPLGEPGPGAALRPRARQRLPPAPAPAPPVVAVALRRRQQLQRPRVREAAAVQLVQDAVHGPVDGELDAAEEGALGGVVDAHVLELAAGEEEGAVGVVADGGEALPAAVVGGGAAVPARAPAGHVPPPLDGPLQDPVLGGPEEELPVQRRAAQLLACGLQVAGGGAGPPGFPERALSVSPPSGVSKGM